MRIMTFLRVFKIYPLISAKKKTYLIVAKIVIFRNNTSWTKSAESVIRDRIMLSL